MNHELKYNKFHYFEKQQLEDYINEMAKNGKYLTKIHSQYLVFKTEPVHEIYYLSLIHIQDAYPIKPNPESVHFALMAMKLSRQDCYFIGDSDVDIETGYRADMKTIGVSWGFRGRLELDVYKRQI